MKTFKQFFENTCNVCANELDVHDYVRNINPECDHFRSEGIVTGVKEIPQDEEKVAGKIIVYRVTNKSRDFHPEEINGVFDVDDILEKTEIQLEKIQ